MAKLYSERADALKVTRFFEQASLDLYRDRRINEAEACCRTLFLVLKQQDQELLKLREEVAALKQQLAELKQDG